MILLVAVVSGLLVGWSWARWRDRTYRAPALRATWLILVGFAPQFVIAYLPVTQHLIPDRLAGFGLTASFIPFLAFVWINRRLPGMPILLIGLILNLTVIVANGGWMPISPETASRLWGASVSEHAALGSRYGQKDILLPIQDMHLGFLADRFLLPAWSPYQVAFSAGDILIAAGAFWLMARPAGNQTISSGESNDHITHIAASQD